MLPNLKTALETLTATITGLSGGSYYGSVPDNATFPYLVFDDLVEGRDSFTGGAWRHVQSVQFSFTGLTEESTGQVMENAFDILQDNISGLSVSGWSTYRIQNIFGAPGVQRFGDVFRGSIDFQIELLKDKS